MTEFYAKQLLDEHRAEYPRFVEGPRAYVVRPDGLVSIWRAVGKSGKRWASAGTETADYFLLPARVRARAVEEAAHFAKAPRKLPRPFSLAELEGMGITL